MSPFSNRRIVEASLVIVGWFAVSTSDAQSPNPNSWNHVANPNGQQVVPLVVYDPSNGLLRVDTRGMNGIDDTPDYTNVGGPIGGDDVGLAILLVETRVQGGIPFPRFNGLDLEQFMTWDARYFNGKYQLVGYPAGGMNGNQFLWPGVYDVWQLPTGLNSGDFGSVEIAVTFQPLSPSAILTCQPPHSFNCVAIGDIPEPSTFLLVAVTLAGLGAFRGRR